MKRLITCLLGISFGLLGLTSCDRPFVDVSTPEIEVLSPDLNLVQVDSIQVLRIRATSFRDVQVATVDGRPMQRNSDNVWELAITLEPGVNTLEVVTFDVEDIPGIDTLQFLHMPFGIDTESPSWPGATGGHAAGLLSDGRVLLTGGTRSFDGEPIADVRRFDPESGLEHSAEFMLGRARAGHTMTAIGNDEFLVVGGARSIRPSEVEEMIEAVEIVSSSGDESRSVVVVGDPIRRAFHTAIVRRTFQGRVLEIFGGHGDVQYRPNPAFGVRDDLRRFLILGDTLEALTPAPGFFLERMSGHLQIDLDRVQDFESSRYLTVGTVVQGAFVDRFAFILDSRDPVGLLVSGLELPSTGRFAAAGALVDLGRVIRFGGVSESTREPSSTVDVFDVEMGRFLSLADGPVGGINSAAYHSATFLTGGRILLLGGFDSSGTPVQSVVYFSVDR